MTGAERIAAERERQVKQEGWTPEHDDRHRRYSLTSAAICYAAHARAGDRFGPHVFDLTRCCTGKDYTFEDPWPWEPSADKRPRVGCALAFDLTPEQRLRLLEKAGALIAAEIDRLLRQQENE